MTQYEINLTVPAFVTLPDGRKIQNGCLADYPGHPMFSRGRLMQFDMLRHTIPFHTQIRSLAKAIEGFPAEWKRQSRVALRLHYGLPADPLDAQPIN